MKEINRRAKPILDNKTDSEWRYRSFDGFIDEKEDFLQVIQNDYNLVDVEMPQMFKTINCKIPKITHKLLAENLKRILEKTEEIRIEKKNGRNDSNYH